MPVQNLTVKLDNVELNARQLAALEKEVNAVVLKHVAATTQVGTIGSKTKINPEWLGIWLKKFKDVPSLKEAGFKKL